MNCPIIIEKSPLSRIFIFTICRTIFPPLWWKKHKCCWFEWCVDLRWWFKGVKMESHRCIYMECIFPTVFDCKTIMAIWWWHLAEWKSRNTVWRNQLVKRLFINTWGSGKLKNSLWHLRWFTFASFQNANEVSFKGRMECHAENSKAS